MLETDGGHSTGAGKSPAKGPCAAMRSAAVVGPSAVLESLIFEADIASIHAKLDELLDLVGTLRLEMAEFKKRAGDVMFMEEDKFPGKLPVEVLSELHDLETFVKSEEGQAKFAQHVKAVGGRNPREFTFRVLKSVLTNTLAELCSWTGRKQNFEVRNLRVFQIMFEVIRRKTGCSKKDFEHHVAMWLRHAKQRRLRENPNPPAPPVKVENIDP